MKSRTYSREDLLDHYADLARQIGTLPRVVDVRRAKGPGWDVYLEFFGGIEDVRIESDVVVHPSAVGSGADLIRERKGSYDKTGLEEHLRALHRDLGRLPGEIDLQKAPGPSYQSYYRRYGGMIEAYDASGLLTFGLQV